MSKETFENHEVHVDDLPSASDLTFERLEGSYKTVLCIPTLLGVMGLMITGHVIFFFVNHSIAFLVFPWLIAPALVLVALVLTITVLHVKACGYSLRDHDIHFRSGILFHKVTSLPFNRIQHVELESGPLDRAYKLSTLKIFTAGGGSTDMRIPGLSYSRASKLRSAILLKAGLDDTGHGDEA